MPEAVDIEASQRRRKASGRARLQAGAQPVLVGFLQLRHLLLDHLHPGRLLHQLRPGWNGGGPAAIAWGWPIISVFILVIGLCMAELVSAYPTSGGIYWWASKLGGPKAGYYTGWLNLIGLLAIVASVAYGCATFFDLTLGFFDSGYHSGNLDHIFLYFLAILVIAALVNIFSSHLLAIINNVSVWWHVFGAAAVVLDPDLPPAPPRQRVRRCSPTRSTTPASSGARPSGFGFIFFVLPLSAHSHPVHHHRLRRLGPPVRGDQERGQLRRQGHVAVDLLLRHRRLDPAAVIPVRSPERGQGHLGRRRRGRHLRPGPHVANGAAWCC